MVFFETHVSVLRVTRMLPYNLWQQVIILSHNKIKPRIPKGRPSILLVSLTVVNKFGIKYKAFPVCFFSALQSVGIISEYYLKGGWTLHPGLQGNNYSIGHPRRI